MVLERRRYCLYTVMKACPATHAGEHFFRGLELCSPPHLSGHRASGSTGRPGGHSPYFCEELGLPGQQHPRRGAEMNAPSLSPLSRRS